MSSCSIVIADHHQDVRNSLKLLIKAIKNWRFLGEADSGEKLLALLKKKTPDIVVIDPTTPSMKGCETIAEIQRRHPGIGTVVLSENLDSQKIKKAMNAGADAFVNKTGSERELVTAIQTVLRGGFYI